MELDPKDLEDMGISESEYVSDGVKSPRVWRVLASAFIFLIVIFS